MTTAHTPSTPNNIVAVLDLPATDSMPRALYLNLGLLSGNLIAMVSVGYKVITSAYGTLPEVDEQAPSGPCLRLGTASFKLTPEEVTHVRAFFQTHSIPCAEPTIRSDSAKQAASVNSSDGKRGESPPPDAMCSGGGALGEQGV